MYPDGGGHDDAGDHQPSDGAPVHREEGVHRWRPYPAQGAAQLGGPLVGAPLTWVHQLGLKRPACGREVESTKNVDDTRSALRAVGTSSTRRAATIGRKMHITVLVPNRKANSTRGA